MNTKLNWLSIMVTFLSMAAVYGIGTTFFTIELERMIESLITPHILSSSKVIAVNRNIYSGIDQFMASNHVRWIGYICVSLILLTALVGLATERKELASLGSIGFILPVYAYFILHMSFLAGLGILTALWVPFWGNLVKLGDIVYLPYMILVYPFSLAGLDIRNFLAGFFTSLGLLIFIMGVMAWLYARFQKKGTADFWLYRFTRHPQYLGWVVWSYGLILQVALRRDTAQQTTNPGASLPWVLSTLIIVCLAFSEETLMRQQQGKEYESYGNQTPFMLPLPGSIRRVISAPFRLIVRKDKPDNRWELVWVFVIYLALIMLLSLPFVLFKWPPRGGWMDWPF